MRLAFAIALGALAAGAPAMAAAKPVTDATVCAEQQGWVDFVAQWNIDFEGALTSQRLTPEVHDYISKRVDELTKGLPVKPTPGDLVNFCEALNVLFPR